MVGKEKRRYIRVDALRDKFLSTRKPKPREICGGGESVMRFFAHVKFCIVCCASLSQAMAPWMLCAMEVLTVLLIYFLATSRSLVIHQVPRHYRFSFTHSLEDIVGICCTRAAILSLAYAIGQRSMHRPYMYTSYLLALLCFPYIVVKTIMFRYGGDGVASAAILALTGLCSWVHVFAARRTVDWTRRRYQMGLAGFGMPWEEGEEAWLMLRRPDLEDMTKTSDGGGPESGGDDLPPELLADDDSRFVELEPGLKVHYKEVVPGGLGLQGLVGEAGGAGASAGSSVGILLVHGFGGGVFAWRHVMEALAMQCHCRVVAFDRPAFGLTSRPKASGSSNPYTVSSQAQLVLKLCSALGLRQVVLVAHADGCLVTLRAAAISASHYQQQGLFMQPQHPFSTISAAVAAAKAMAEQQQQQQQLASLAQLHSRSAPPTADSSPKLIGSPHSPASDQYSPQQLAGGAVPLGPLAHGSAAGLGGTASTQGDAGSAAYSPLLSNGGQLQMSDVGAGGGPGSDRDRQEDGVPRSASTGMFAGVAAAAHATLGSGAERRGQSCSTSASPGVSNHYQAHGHGHGHASSHGGSIHGASAQHHHTVPGAQVCLPMSTPVCAGQGLAACSPSLLDIEAGPVEQDRLHSVSGAPTVVTLGAGPPGGPAAVSSSVAAGVSRQTHHRRTTSLPGPNGSSAPGGSARSSDGWEAGSANGSCGGLLPRYSSGGRAVQPPSQPLPYVLGLVLLHPNLSGVMGPAFSRVLARSTLGRSILRPLLRTEVGEIANRRAWHNTDKLTSEVLELYKTPLRVEGWDSALIETTRQRREACQGDLASYCGDVQAIPTLILTGQHDRIVPPAKSEALSVDLPHARLAVLSDCGHLSHEEAPSALLEQLVPFCGEALCSHQQQQQQGYGRGQGGPSGQQYRL